MSEVANIEIARSLVSVEQTVEQLAYAGRSDGDVSKLFERLARPHARRLHRARVLEPRAR